MTDAEALTRYHAFHAYRLGGGGGAEVVIKPGVRGYPGLAPGAGLLLEAAPRATGEALDLSGSAGTIALATSRSGVPTRLLEPSCAGVRCAERTLAGRPAPVAGLPWDAPAGSADTVFVLPATDRGSRRVEAELAAAHQALRAGGTLYAVMHKDRGAKRYERFAAALFGGVRILARESGWRLVTADRAEGDTAPLDPWILFELAGHPFAAQVGVFSAGKLDGGSALLLDALAPERLAGREVLDLGCGYGVLALAAARAGARVTAVDDDLAAVRSTRRSAELQRLDVAVLHSDVDSALAEDARFDMVITNPPFHVGKQVRLELPGAFIAAAARLLRPGGELLLVANRALPYEALLAGWRDHHTLTEAGGFKVLWAGR